MRISDWSSDVCSSDRVLSREVGLVSTAEQLNAAGDSAVNQGHTAPAPETFVQFSEVSVVQTVIRIVDESLRDRRTRSAERRVGKEEVSRGRLRWSTEL